ncbi:MAG: YciI family protein [Acidobacteriota bacterium]
MAKFMFLMRGDCTQAAEMSPEQKQQTMQEYGAWFQDGMQAGWLLDTGNGLDADGRVVHPDQTVTDGPFAESKELVGGYMLVEAADYDTAVELVKGSPMVKGGSTIEVRKLAENAME